MKRVLVLTLLLLLTTGCTCEYNLKIDNNDYQEEIKLVGENSTEINSFKEDWKIPVDKDEYNIGLDLDNVEIKSDNVYNYNLLNNILTFKYNFTSSTFINSSAVSNCYNKLSVMNYSDSTIISTSKNALCFDKYPTLTSIVINITVDKPVKSNNADRISANTYTWNLTRTNASDKPINLVLDNKNVSNNPKTNSTPDETINKTRKKDYSMYIFSGLLLIVMLLGYFLFNKLRNKEDNT